MIFSAQYTGGLIRRIIIGRGQHKVGQAGCGGHSRQDDTGLAFPYGLLSFCPRRWLQINHRKDHRGARSSGRRGGFLSIRGHRHKCRSTLSGTGPRREWLQQKPLASAGRICNESIYQLFAVRAGNNFCGVRTPKADGSGQQAAHRRLQ